MSPERSPVLVVGYDGSEESQAAVAYAARRAGPAGRIVVVHALAPSLPLVNVVTVGAESSEHGAAVLDGLLMEQGDELTGTTFDLEAPRARPAEALVDTARKVDADEIVVGSRGLGRVESALGSVSAELLRQADRPVTVIPCGALG